MREVVTRVSIMYFKVMGLNPIRIGGKEEREMHKPLPDPTPRERRWRT